MFSSSFQVLRKVHPRTWFIAETLFLLTASFGVSIVVPGIRTPFALTGSIAGSSLVFIFPPAFYLKLRREVMTDPKVGHRSSEEEIWTEAF